MIFYDYSLSTDGPQTESRGRVKEEHTQGPFLCSGSGGLRAGYCMLLKRLTGKETGFLRFRIGRIFLQGCHPTVGVGTQFKLAG